MINSFKFFKNKTEIKENLNVKFIKIKENISDKKDLLDTYFLKLNFPFYFGYNWDALYDSLSEIVEKNKMCIIHEDIPLKNTESENEKYLHLLYDLANHSNSNVEIWFPEKYKKEIELVLKMKK